MAKGRIFHKISLFPAVCALLAFALAGSTLTAAAQEDRATGPSGDPVPRFVSITALEAYMRVGPGRQYPIDWLYRASGLPLEVIGEYGPWRRVREQDGTTGWMHVSLLGNRRTALVTGGKRRLYEDPDTASRIVIEAAEAARGTVTECAGNWCRMDFSGPKGWIPRRHIWGIYRHENFD